MNCDEVKSITKPTQLFLAGVAIVIVLMLSVQFSSMISNEKSPIPPTQAIEPVAVNVAYVYGFVIKPGVYKIADNIRVIDVINQAGGFAPGADETDVNLAARVSNGTTIRVSGRIAQSASLPFQLKAK